MDKNSVDWRGHWVALVTPFDAAGNVDEAAFRLNVEQCISTVGVAGLVPCGCTGEFWAQTNEERKRVIKACVETAAGRVPVVAGTGAIRTADVIELSDSARQAGCDGVMIVAPFFVKPSADDIVAHYQAVSDAVDVPIMLYNIPSAAVNALTPALVDRLADIDNVVAIKESSFDFNNFYGTIVVAGDRDAADAGTVQPLDAALDRIERLVEAAIMVDDVAGNEQGVDLLLDGEVNDPLPHLHRRVITRHVRRQFRAAAADVQVGSYE